MKKLYILLILSLFSLTVSSQNDSRAKQILDKTFSAINSSNGIQIKFKGTSSGTLLMKKAKFHLNSNEIQTWFDGKTQWSYVKGSDEVNISSPTPAELHSVNPYFILSSYKKGFNYKYVGEKSVSGKKTYQIMLTPQKNGSIKSISLFITPNNEPLMINVSEKNKKSYNWHVISYNNKLKLNDSTFRFDKEKYPNAEIIDLR